MRMPNAGTVLFMIVFSQMRSCGLCRSISRALLSRQMERACSAQAVINGISKGYGKRSA
jgi:hypothetical protein